MLWRTAAGEKRSAEKCKKLNLTAKSIFGVLGRFLQSRVERNAIDNRSSEKKKLLAELLLFRRAAIDRCLLAKRTRRRDVGGMKLSGGFIDQSRVFPGAELVRMPSDVNGHFAL